MGDDPVTKALLAAITQAREVTERATRTSTGLLRMAAQGPLRLFGEGMRMAEGVMVESLRQALEIPELRQAVSMLQAQEATGPTVNSVLDAAEVDVDDEDRLRRRFNALLDRSLDPDAEGGLHPAFRRILAQLSPDEARILRLFHGSGPQAVMDVVAAKGAITRGGTVVASNLTRVGDHAGCLEPDRGSMYLDNLERLGLVHVDDEELPDHDDYDLISVGPEYQAAVKEAGHRGARARGVRRSARLTTLGRRLLDIVLTPDGGPT